MSTQTSATVAPVALTAPVIAIIPAFNEERSLGSVVLRLRNLVDEVIVVNDGSHDATAEVARLAGATVIDHPTNHGYGSAIRTGLEAAERRKPAAVVLMDADGQHRIEDVPLLLDPIVDGTADIAVGSRFMDERTRVPTIRRFAQHGLTLLTNVGSGVALTDSQSGMRAFGPRAIKSLLIRSASMSAASEMQFLASDAQLRVREVPIQVRYYEEVKRSPLTHGLDVLNGILLLISQRRPLMFFGLPGLALVLLSTFFGVDVLQTFERTRILLVGQLIGSVALSLVGVLALFTALVLNALQDLRRELHRQHAE